MLVCVCVFLAYEVALLIYFLCYCVFSTCGHSSTHASCVCAGKELVSFCVRVSRLFNMDCEDAGQKHRYRALLTVIRAIHLTEGSSIMAICHIPRGKETKLVTKYITLGSIVTMNKDD